MSSVKRKSSLNEKTSVNKQVFSNEKSSGQRMGLSPEKDPGHRLSENQGLKGSGNRLGENQVLLPSPLETWEKQRIKEHQEVETVSRRILPLPATRKLLNVSQLLAKFLYKIECVQLI